MADSADQKPRSSLRALLRPRVAWWCGLVLLLALGLPRILHQVRGCFAPPAGRPYHGMVLGDFTSLMRFIDDFLETGVLYDTTGVDPYGPITISMLKYPPPHAAFLLALVPTGDRWNPQVSREGMSVLEARRAAAARIFQRARPLFILYLASLLASLVLVLVFLKPGWELGGLIALIFLNWQPHWENMEGPGIESLLLLFFALSMAALRAGHRSIAGVPVGVAGALKVYPWGAALLFLSHRRGLRLALGVLAGTVLAFAASTFFVPLRISFEYLIRILPEVGGASGLRDNLSAAGNLSRLAYGLTGVEAPVILPLRLGDLLHGLPPSLPDLLTLASWLALSLLLVVFSLRAVRQTDSQADSRGDLLRLALSVSLVIFLMPTAWSAYQTVLLIPLAVGMTYAPAPRRAKLIWSLLLFAAAAGAVNIGAAASLPRVVLRSLVPLALWIACLRLLGLRETGEPSRRIEIAPGA